MSFVACGCETAWVQPGYTDICSGNQYVAFMTIVDFFIRYTCKVSDPCGRVVPKLQPREEYDFIVVGSGSGGSTIAGRLAEQKGWNTLLLEAGMDEPPASQVPLSNSFVGTDIDWGYKLEAQNTACLSTDGVCSWPRGKVLGGTSVLNGMMYIRPTRADFQRWVDAGNTKWNYDSMLPIFKRSEDNRQIGVLTSKKYHGTGGPLTIQQFNHHPKVAEDLLIAAKQLGYPVSNDLNGDHHTGFAIAQANNRNGARLSTSKAFVRPHKNAKNFDVMINSTVTKIQVSGDGFNKKATGVEFVYKGQTFTVKARKEVILAAGAVATPQLLLLSGIGDKNELDKVGIKQVHNLPGVGKGIQNHVAFKFLTTVNETNTADLHIAALEEYITTQRGPLSGTGLQQMTARLTSKYSTPDDPDVQLFFSGRKNGCSTNGIPGAPMDIENPSAQRSIAITCVNLHPKSKGNITLASKNAMDHPKIYGNYLTDPQDIKVLVEAVKMSLRILDAPILKEKYNIKLVNSTYGDCASLHKWGTDEFWECAIRFNTRPENHQSSSCKMGLSTDSEACVDQKLKVHGISNLRITDASVIVIPPSGNTQAIIVAIAERAYEFIKKDHKH